MLDRSEAFILKLERKLLEMKRLNPETTWQDALKQIEAEEHHLYSEIIEPGQLLNNSPLLSREAINPEDNYQLKNIYRVIRSNIEMVDLVADLKSFFEASKFFYNIENMGKLLDVVTLFFSAYKAGLITFDLTSNKWFVTYSTNSYNTPVLFFDENDKMIPDFDEVLKNFYLIGAFKKVYEDEVYRSGIMEIFKPIENNSAQLQSIQAFVDDLRNIMNTPLFANRDIQVRDSKIMERLQNSYYKGCCNFPKIYRNAQALIDNINTVIATVDSYVENKGVQ